MTKPQYMTTQQTADLLKVDRSLILQWCRGGQVEGAFKANPTYHNSPWMIPTATAEALRIERERNTTSPADIEDDDQPT